MASDTPIGAVNTLSFDAFWEWLLDHSNCILRAGTPEAVLFDDEDYHWIASEVDPDTRLVQLVRGKRPVGEFIIVPSHVSYVQIQPAEEDAYLFECISEGEVERMATSHFLMAHSYEAEEPESERSWIN